MSLFTTRKSKGLQFRVAMVRCSSLTVIAALLALAGICVLFDISNWYEQSTAQHEPDELFVSRAAQLDDPVGFLKGSNNKSSSGRAVTYQTHGSMHDEQQSNQQQSGYICTNTCYKANDGICDEGRRGNLTVGSGTNWVHCDLGTDCQDCGPWQGVQHGPDWTENVGPITYLRLYNIEVRVKQVPFAPHFIFAFTDPTIDRDQSEHMNLNGVVEPGISQVFYKVLSKRCSRDAPGSSGFVVDVGGNYGWFSLLSASLGCSVLTIEPVPVFRAFMEYSAARNHLTPLIEVIPAVVALDTSRTYTINAPLVPGAQWGASGMDVPNHPGSMQVPAKAVRLDDLAYPRSISLRALLELFSSGSSRKGSSKGPQLTITSSTGGDDTPNRSSSTSSNAAATPSGTNSDSSGIQAANSATGSSSSSAGGAGSTGGSKRRSHKLTSRLLPEKLAHGIDILKVDVEGREPDVFATATKLLDSGKVANIIMEYSPGYYYQVTDRLAEMELLPSLLLEVLSHNYSMVHMPWSIAHDVRAMQAAKSWDTVLPVMDAITAPQLAYDLWTTQHIKNGTLPGMHGPTSWPCPEMAKSGMAYAEPGYERLGMHIAFHPKSFMAHFVFNTNIWATKDKTLQLAGTNLFNDRELFPFYYPSNSRWFPQSATSDTHLFGLPWVLCQDIQPKFQVAHRCRCRNWDVCGQHQVAAQQCVLKKHTGYDNLPDELVGSAMNQAATIMAQRAAQTSAGPQ